jgi:hypothetical protein
MSRSQVFLLPEYTNHPAIGTQKLFFPDCLPLPYPGVPPTHALRARPSLSIQDQQSQIGRHEPQVRKGTVEQIMDRLSRLEKLLLSPVRNKEGGPTMYCTPESGEDRIGDVAEGRWKM